MLLNKDPSLLPLLLCLAAPRSHDTSHTFHPVIQHPMSPSQKGTPAVKRTSTACTRRSGEGCPPNTPLRFDKRKGCVRTYSMYSLLFSFVTIISDPLGFRSTCKSEVLTCIDPGGAAGAQKKARGRQTPAPAAQKGCPQGPAGVKGRKVCKVGAW